MLTQVKMATRSILEVVSAQEGGADPPGLKTKPETQWQEVCF